ncbi:hypothetical protein FHW96_002158 [Novosphingobium sp. SG751A]|uniref:hypothetical protein n=1 Tax=Novosphingobium sp. SG751A TaxID=2587000 RepID=UPI001556E887|nr:hypothetical protein [Novosphingobium sp. SG751A]
MLIETRDQNWAMFFFERHSLALQEHFYILFRPEARQVDVEPIEGLLAANDSHAALEATLTRGDGTLRPGMTPR